MIAPLFLRGCVYECRAPRTRQGTISGYFEDSDRLYQAIQQYDGKVPGLYVTINPVNPALLARAKNRFITHAKATTSDADVIRRDWILIDCDAKRPSGISANNAEHEQALRRAAMVRDWLAGEGWAEPVMADSGNGAHLLYRVGLSNDEVATHTIKALLNFLAFKFNDSSVTVDTSVFNAARITKFYGTLVCKGDSTEDRPHRRSQILSVPSEILVVPQEKLLELAQLMPSDARSHNQSMSGHMLDARDFLSRHGLLLFREKPWRGGTMFELEACPFNEEHIRSASIIQFPTGALSFQCFHNSCQGNHWQELRDLLEPGRPQSHSGCSKAASRPDVELINASTIRPTATLWAVQDRVPLNAVTAIAGPPGLGKTMLTLEWAAGWTHGRIHGALRAQPVSVVIASAEDSHSATLVPRLTAAKADLTKILFSQVKRDGHTGGLLIPDDISSLRLSLLKSHARFLIIDPLMAHLPGTINSWRDQDVRRALAPLADLAEELTLAVLVVMHLNKGEGKEALARVGGSIGIVAAARSVLLVTADPEDPDSDVRMLGHLKCNVGPLSPTLKFRLEERSVSFDGTSARTSGIVWNGEAAHLAAADLLMQQERVSRGDRLHAIDWLRQELADGPQHARRLIEHAQKLGISETTLRRAKAALGVKDKRVGFGKDGKWFWFLSDVGDQSSISPPDDYLLVETPPNTLKNSKASIGDQNCQVNTNEITNDTAIDDHKDDQQQRLIINGQSMDVSRSYRDKTPIDDQQIEEVDLNAD
jgi:hypothetical protein